MYQRSYVTHLYLFSTYQEQETRIEFMRKRSKGGEVDGQSKRTKVEEVPTNDTPQHINFFSDLQTGVNKLLSVMHAECAS